nr:thiamine phosphate synthase [Desulfosporosinus acidiphilus]
MKADYSLYLVTDRVLLGSRDLIQSVELAIQGGVTMVQLREKSVSTGEFLNIAYELKDLTSRYKIPLIINDRLDIALAVNAEGLHVGQDDLPMSKAKELFPDKIIGVSVSCLAEALLAEEQGADYLGAGAIYSTSTKADAKLVSLHELELIKKSVKIPVVAIGGINQQTIRQVMFAKIDGVAIVSAILAQDDIYQAAHDFRKLLASS